MLSFSNDITRFNASRATPTTTTTETQAIRSCLTRRRTS